MSQNSDVILFSNTKDTESIRNFVSFLKLLLHRVCSKEIHINTINTYEENEHLLVDSKVILVVVQNEDELINNSSDLQKFINNSDIQSKLFVIFSSEISHNQESKLILKNSSYFFSKQDFLGSEVSIGNIKNNIFLRMLDLAYDISPFFEEKDKNTVAKSKNVFFTDVTKDQIANRNNLMRELKQFSYKVSYINNSISDLKEMKTFLEKSLRESEIVIHIFGSIYESEKEYQGVSLPEYHYKFVNEYFNDNNKLLSNTYRYVWIQPNIKIDSEKQKMFLEHLKRDNSLLTNTEILQIPIEDFKTVIRKRLMLKKSSQKENNITDNNDGKKIYIITENRDIIKIKSLADSISKKGHRAIFTDFQGNRNLVEEHRKNLINCDAVIIYYSGHNSFWVNSKIKDIIKSPGYGRTNAFLEKAIIIEKEQPPLLPKDFIIINNEDSFSASSLKSFFEKII